MKALLGKEVTLAGEMELSKWMENLHIYIQQRKSANLRTCHAQEKGDEDLETEEVALKSQKNRREEAVLNCTG